MLDPPCAAVGKRGSQLQAQTVLRRHPADPRNQERSQTTTIRNFSFGGANTLQVALSGKTAQNESFLTSGSSSLRKILLLTGIHSVADGTRTVATLVKHNTKPQPADKCLQRVLNRSLALSTPYSCNRRSVWRQHAVETITLSCYVLTASISTNLCVSLKRTPCCVPHYCSSKFNETQIGFQKYADGIQK